MTALKLIILGVLYMMPASVELLELDYQQLDIAENVITLGWMFDTGGICSTVFKLQGFSLSSVTNGVSTLANAEFEYTFNNSSTGEIPSNRLRTSTGDPIVYRLVAVDENGTICSQMITLLTFFRFDVSERRETRVLAPNSTTCYDIPVTNICTSSLTFVWPQSLQFDSGLSCVCPIHNSAVGRTVFESCACLQSSDIVPWFAQDGSICLSDQNSELNEIVVNFQCTTDPCIGDCILHTIISQFRIIIPATTTTTMATAESTSAKATHTTSSIKTTIAYTTTADSTSAPDFPTAGTIAGIIIGLCVFFIMIGVIIAIIWKIVSRKQRVIQRQNEQELIEIPLGENRGANQMIEVDKDVLAATVNMMYYNEPTEPRGSHSLPGIISTDSTSENRAVMVQENTNAAENNLDSLSAEVLFFDETH